MRMGRRRTSYCVVLPVGLRTEPPRTLDDFSAYEHNQLLSMKVREVIRALEDRGAVHVRSHGDHRRYTSECGKCHTSVDGKPSADVPTGTLLAIERDMAPCYGKRWLRGRR
jgi:predicted RNA binding protein YcfA (HicA-like mRNA interferase family)